MLKVTIIFFQTCFTFQSMNSLGRLKEIVVKRMKKESNTANKVTTSRNVVWTKIESGKHTRKMSCNVWIPTCHFWFYSPFSYKNSIFWQLTLMRKVVSVSSSSQLDTSGERIKRQSDWQEIWFYKTEKEKLFEILFYFPLQSRSPLIMRGHVHVQHARPHKLTIDFNLHIDGVGSK